MTLSPVFHDLEKLDAVIRAFGERDFSEALAVQKRAVDKLFTDLEKIIGEEFRDEELAKTLSPENPSEFAQRYFFITLFTLIFKNLGVDKRRLDFYARLHYCIMGTTAAADNLFDGEDKAFLPLGLGGGATYHSVLQLMCFERLLAKVGRRAEAEGICDEETFARIHRGLLDTMASIGSLEGSEEGGVTSIPTPEDMITKVHGVRGGTLFALATIAPAELEEDEKLKTIKAAAEAIRDLGTAFQIVDDICDFEFDLSRKSHNILVSQIHHEGSESERAALDEAMTSAKEIENFVEDHAADSGARALSRAVFLIGSALMKMESLGFAIDLEMAENLAVCFASTRGTPRLETLSKLL